MARTTGYGITSWGRWFADALEGFDESGRLSRGKSYANTGKVESIEFKGRSAIAKVRGHSSPWYKVRIDFPALGADETMRILDIIEAEPFLLAKIEAGELPDELAEALRKNGVELIPSAWSSMKRSCSCPDWGDPCKHMAAVYYLIAQEVDRDPRLLFSLRGLDLEAVLGASAEFGHDHGDVEAVLPPPFAMRPESLPREAPPAAAPELPRIESYLGLLQSLIPPRPPIAEADFGAALVEFYHRAAASALVDTDTGDEPNTSREDGLERHFSSARYTIDYEGSDPLLAAIGKRGLRVTAIGSSGAARDMSVAQAVELFLLCEDERGTPGYRFLFHLSRLIRSAWRAAAFVPFPMLGASGASLSLLWAPLPAARDLGAALDEIGRYDPGILSRRGKKTAYGGAGTARLLASACFGEWARSLGFRPSGERSETRALSDLFFAGCALDVSGPGSRALPRAIASWLSVFNLDFGASNRLLKIQRFLVGEEKRKLF